MTTSNLHLENINTEAIMTGLESMGQGVQDMYLRDDAKLVVLIDQENIAVFPWKGLRKESLDQILDEINTLRLLGALKPPSTSAPDAWEWTDYKEVVDDPM